MLVLKKIKDSFSCYPVVEQRFCQGVFVLSTLILFHAYLFIYLRSNCPVGLLSVPVVLILHFNMADQPAPRKLYFGYLGAFFVLLLFYAYVLFFDDEQGALKEIYMYVYYFLMVAAYSIIPAYILLQRRNWQQPVDWNKSRLIVLLCIISFMISILLSFHLLYMIASYSYQEVGALFPYAIYMLMFFSLIIGFHYLFTAMREKKAAALVEEYPSQKKKSFLSQDVLESYEAQLKELLEVRQLYLRYDMSIDLLANESGIPRHHLSELFNHHLQAPFYRFIATYRISYAIEKLNQHDCNLTLEGLAYESGFNSKTTFAKYFKEIVGCSLTEYRQKQQAEGSDSSASERGGAL